MSLGNTGLNKCDQESSICCQALRAFNLCLGSSHGGCMPCVPYVWLWNAHGGAVTRSRVCPNIPREKLL